MPFVGGGLIRALDCFLRKVGFMKAFVALALCLFSLTFVPQEKTKLEIGAKLSRKYIPKKVTEQIATHPSQFRPFIKRTIDGVEYIIAYDEKNREIKYIHTTDKNFRTASGLRVGSEIPLKREQLVVYPSWEIRAPKTSDGWYPVVGVDLPIGYDLVGAFKDDETKMVTIIGFSKGGN
jgi:hypothetical protein